jgi:hypothetical protein
VSEAIGPPGGRLTVVEADGRTVDDTAVDRPPADGGGKLTVKRSWKGA